MDQFEYDILHLYNKNERYCLRRRAKSFVVKEGVLFYGDKEGLECQVI